MKRALSLVASSLLTSFASAIAASLDCVTIARLESAGNYREVLSSCAKDDSARSLCIQGDYLYHGRKGVSMDRPRGQALYRRALEKLFPDAEAGDVDAQYWTARCLEYGTRDLKAARKWYMKAADAGNAKAMFKAAWFSARRIGAAGTSPGEAREAALRYAKAASDAGNADGTALTAWLTFIDCRGGRDFENALPGIMESVDGNSPLGKMLLGRIYIEGAVVRQDMEKAVTLFQEAVDQGCSEARDALEEIGKRCAKDENGEKPGKAAPGDAAFGMSASDVMAKRGADLYERPETRKEGLALLRKTADAGSPFALARLSALYYLGEGGVRQDCEKALRLMKSAVSKGFPASLLPIKEAETVCRRSNESKEKSSAQPGDGYPGSLGPYAVSQDLRRQLDRFNLTAGWFRRDSGVASLLSAQEKGGLLANEIPFLLFKPRRGLKPVPLLVYFGGTGEQGTDLLAHFKQSTIFSKITSPGFQEKHPCYLFAPMVPKGASIRCSKSWSPPIADLVCDAMYAVIREATNPRVDTNRLYLTGLSYGGSAAWTFSFGYPGRFAASIPVAGFCEAFAVPDERPGSIWLLYNESEFNSEDDRRALADVARAIKERGGEFRMSSFPDAGHNAWDKAWSEDSVWEWMFSKNACGRTASKSPRVSRAAGPEGGISALEGVVCSASKPGMDNATSPERAVDGLDATCYVSAEPFRRGDWWQVEFAQAVSGRITVKSGRRDGTGRVVFARLETSANGRRWLTAGRFRRDNGECTFVPRTPVKFLRVVSDSQKGEPLVLREVVVQ